MHEGSVEASVRSKIIEARALTITFASKGGTVRALDHVSLDIEAGETIGIIGESGSGKTTLARSLLGLIRPMGGHVLLRGADVYGLPPRRRFRTISRDIALVFQDPRSSLNPRLSVGAAVRDPMTVLRICPRGERDARAADLLESVGLPRSIAHRPIRSLSGGQLQRVAIARALAVEPSVIVADEPTSALDVSVQGEVLNLLKQLRAERGLALMLITHDIRVVRFMADRTVVMRNGHIVEEGASDLIYDDPQHDYTKKLLAAAPYLRTPTQRHQLGSV